MKYIATLILITILVSCQNAQDYHKKANAHEAENKFEEAIDFLDKAIELDPFYMDAYLDRGADRSILGNYIEAIDDYSLVLELDSANILAYYNRAKNFSRLNRLEQAFDDLSNALKIATHNGVGLAEGKAFTEHAGKYDVPVAEIVFERGAIYFELDSLDNTIEDMSFYLKQGGTIPDAHFLRGMAYVKKGNTELARHDLQKAQQGGMSEAGLAIEEYCAP